MTTKITDANIDSNNLDNTNFNIGLLGFKMAVNEGLTVFNLVDGVVDEFNDESGTDEAEGTNDIYCASGDFYQNVTLTPTSISAGFTMTTITEPDTSTAGTNPTQGAGSFGSFTVPTGMTSTNIYAFGAAGGNSGVNTSYTSAGGGGGFASGTLAVTSGQTLYVIAGEGGEDSRGGGPFWNGGPSTICTPGLDTYTASGGGLAGVFNTDMGPLSTPQYSAPQAYLIAGAGGGSALGNVNPYAGNAGAGGGTIGYAGGGNSCNGYNNTQTAGNFQCKHGGGAGDQEQGGQGNPQAPTASPGGLFRGGGNDAGTPGDASFGGGGGGGFYGGGAGGKSGLGAPGDPAGAGGGGSSYYGHPQITCGATEGGGNSNPIRGESGGTASPFYICGVGENGNTGPGSSGPGEDGYVLITGSYCASSPGGSTTIVSQPFTSTTVPTSSRIVVFEENVDSPTLNTDIIASVSRDGTNFTNVTLADSGYVTGSSGQRILTGQVDISGQPSGQSMRWKLALANNTVKIHGVSLQWS